jgi:phage host-nuclease inhibitor protein Gam
LATKAGCPPDEARPPSARLRSWKDVDRALKRIAEVKRERSRLESQCRQQALTFLSSANKEIAAVRAEFQPSLDLLDVKSEVLQEQVEAFARTRKAEFGPPREEKFRFRDLPNGRLGWRLAPPVLTFLRPAAEIVEALRAVGLGTAIVATEERPSREQLHDLCRKGAIDQAMLRELGIRRVQPDEFVLEVRQAPAVQAAAP